MTDQEFNTMSDLLDATLILKSNLTISEWWESRMISPPDSPYAGRPISYNDTPWWKEPTDFLHPDHPARKVSIMSQAQGGKTTMVILPNVCYTIDQDPSNIIYLTGASGLSPEAMAKLEFAIEACGLQDQIQPNRVKAKNSRTGDTIKKKEFKGFDLKMGNLNDHNFMRQHTARKLIGDDISAAAVLKAMTGDTIGKFETRAKSHEDTAKILLISTPQMAGHCNIEAQINKSDKRLFFVECPKCSSLSGDRRIDLRFPFKIEDTKEMAGLTWKLNNLGKVEQKSVGYICQKCAGFFTDQGKYEMMLGGIWRATQVPQELNHYGFKLNGLYSAPGMTGWFTLATKWHELNPDGNVRKVAEWQTFVNDDCGDVYVPETDSPKATELLKKSRNYEIGVIPEAVSEADGNGDILLIVFSADCNGLLNDARIDYQLKAVSRNGATYSFKSGSLGTFIPNQSPDQKAKTIRQKWTYELNRENSVWKLVDEVFNTVYKTDTGRLMKIGVGGLDAGYLTDHIFNYIDKAPFPIFGLMGDKENDLVRVQENIPIFKQAASRHNLFMINVNAVKDTIANRMKLPWDRKNDISQPHEFMNFPQYDYHNFFEHYESESRRENDKGYFGWQKKGPTVQNHFWDTEVYFVAVLEVYLWRLFKKGAKEEVFTWTHYASHCPPRKK